MTEAFLLEIIHVDERQIIDFQLHRQNVVLYQQLGLSFCPPYVTFLLQ